MKKVILRWHHNQFWMKGELEIHYPDGKIDKVSINKYYSVEKDWIYIYDVVGGSGTGFSQGDIIRKIYIGDAEFELIEEA